MRSTLLPLRLTRGSITTTLVTVTVLGVLTAVSGAAPVEASQRRVIPAGHVDVFKVVWDGTALDLVMADDSQPGNPVIADPDEVVLNPGPVHAVTFAANAPSGLAGTTGYLMPQSVPNLSTHLWPGWSTERPGAGSIGTGDGLPTGVLTGALSLRILSVTGPGSLHLWQTNSFGTPTVLVNSADGLPDSITVNQGTHVHANWAFTEPGTYTVTAEMTGTAVGGGSLSTGPTDYRWEVGGTEPVTVLATPDLTPLMSALAQAIPELALVDSTATTMTVDGCVPPPASRPLPATPSDYTALLAGDPYTGAGGTAVAGQPVSCRPDAVTTYGTS